MFNSPTGKPCLILLTSKSGSSAFQINERGIKVSQLIKLKKTFNSFNIDWVIATVGGKKPLVDLERDESSKEWVRENQERLTVPVDFLKLSAKEYSGLILPNLLGFYQEFFEELNQESNIDKDRKELLKELSSEGVYAFFKEFISLGKPIGCIGYGIVPLFQSIDAKDGSWLFKKYAMTGISILAECREAHFASLPFIIEETVRYLKGTFVSSQDVVGEFLMIDRNFITAQNDSSFLSVLKNIAHLITRDSVF